ncbi:DoxX family protein [Nesterenkonia halobia]|uniref:DoxX-like protein n=1 Tax=Nesterenkonia halobia TaxID=37922 RepID=A0ABP6RDS7_9MICC
MDTIPDITLWTLQWFLSCWFVVSTAVALPLVLSGRLGADRVPGFAALSRPMLTFMGIAHIAGGIGLVLPQSFGVLPWLTPTAGLALAVQCFMAAGYHLRAGEDALEPALWGLLCGAVFIGRIDLLAGATSLPRLTPVVVVAGLFAALVVNLALLLRGPQSPLRRAEE